jgi:aminoglycoside phosphotransferase (APT) family kinase protein
MTERVAELVAHHLPSYTVTSVTRLGHGLENEAYLVNDEVVVRLRASLYDGLGLDVEREAEVLARVVEVSPLPVPVVLFVDAAVGALAYRKLAGTSLFGASAGYGPELSRALGEFLGSIHAMDGMASLVPRDVQLLAGWLDDARRDLPVFASLLAPDSLVAVEEFLATAPPADPTRLAFCHNDLGAEHILVDGPSGEGAGALAGSVTGILDWTDAAMMDPAYDFGLIRRDGGAAALEVAVAHYGLPFDAADRERAVFYSRCALLEDLAHGVRSGDSRFVRSALAQLPAVFAD